MNKKTISLILLAVIFSWFHFPAHAANFYATCPERNELDVGCWIDMHGQIVEGDANKLLAIVSVKPKTTDIYRWLVLDSPGGDVREALKLARVVRDAMLSTQNYSAAPSANNWGKNIYVCASSCVIVAMAGVERAFWLHKGGGLGLHRPYIQNSSIQNISPSSLAEAQNQVMRSVREYFVGEGMSQRLIEEMMNRSSKDIYWVTTQDVLLDFPHTSVWYEEMLIAQCKYDPSVNERWAKASMNRQERAMKAVQDEMIRTARCSRSLIELAQKKLQNKYKTGP